MAVQDKTSDFVDFMKANYVSHTNMATNEIFERGRDDHGTEFQYRASGNVTVKELVISQGSLLKLDVPSTPSGFLYVADLVLSFAYIGSSRGELWKRINPVSFDFTSFGT